MKKSRKIIEIDEEKCTGCGECIITCAEGALALVDGKARLVGDIYCDGLGACLGDCPEDALTIVEREAVDFDEEVVEKRLKVLGRPSLQEAEPSGPEKSEPESETMACGCPGSQTRVIEAPEAASDEAEAGEIVSELRQWPLKLQLLGPGAPFLKGSDLLFMADCVAVSFPDLHRKILKGNAVAIGCPKLDDLEAHIERLSDIIKGSGLRSLTVVHMEVPCCFGFVHAAQKAVERSGVDLPLKRVQIGVSGEIQEEEDLNAPGSLIAANS